MPRTPDQSTDHVRARLLAVAAAVLVIFLLRATRPVTMPLALGLTFAVIAWPVLEWVARRAPRWLGLLAAVLTIVLALAGVFSALGWSADLLAERARRDQDRIATLRRDAAAVGARFGVSMPGGGQAQGGGQTQGDPQDDPQRAAEGGGGGEKRQPGLAQRVGAALYGSLTSLALAVGFAALALAEVDAVRRRVRRRFDPEAAERGLATAAEVAGSVRRYFAVKTLTSVITGTATGLYALLVGLDLAAIWGMLAFLLEYVPSIGSLIAVVPPTVFAFLQFDGLARPLAIGGGLVLLQLVLGNFVDPKIEGRFMSVSPLVVLLSIVFWAWVWGPFGALLGVPITVALTIVARQFPGTRWAWALLTEEERGEAGEGRRA